MSSSVLARFQRTRYLVRERRRPPGVLVHALARREARRDLTVDVRREAAPGLARRDGACKIATLHTPAGISRPSLAASRSAVIGRQSPELATLVLGVAAPHVSQRLFSRFNGVLADVV